MLATLAAALQMHDRLNLPKDPYGAMMQMGDRRTAIPSDWKGESISVLERLGCRATNPVIRARLCDIAWFLQRNLVQTGHQAAAAYLATARGLCDGMIADATDGQVPGVWILTLQKALRRGLQICMQLRPADPELGELEAFIFDAADQFEAKGNPRALLAMLTLAYDFELGDPAAYAGRIEQAATQQGEGGPHITTDALVLAAKAWRRAKDTDGHDRCMMQASEAMVAHANSINQAFSASHFLQEAINLLRGLRSPAAKDRKRDLRIDLIRMQAAAEDEMGVFEHPADLTKLIEWTTEHTNGVTLLDGLFLLAAINRPKSISDLTTEARRNIVDHPLTAMFGVQQHDADGYVRFRAPGASPGQESPEALEHQIAKQEEIHRQVVVEGQIKIVIRNLASHFPISEGDILPLCRESPFVPTDLSRTYARGLTAFFHGDMTTALSILTPLLEASLVYVLKGHDVDVVRHDEEAGTQEDMTITQLFKNLRKELDDIFGDAITGDIDRVFLARSGPCLRHAVAHGTMHDQTPYMPDAIYACWLILHLCLLPLFDRYKQLRVGTDSQEPAAEDGVSVSDAAGEI
ncbi:hypothetical protein ISP25_05060 [Rhodanobacter hydrolyticus]|uniref:DUF7380 domain-containing protein n=1 Tax=Rhodanobacter hydrolyticus TaxID=2250595 RepID=A0ABW8J3R1_9GAMM